VTDARPEAIVGANDWTAARVMRTLLELGRAVPDEVRLVGIGPKAPPMTSCATRSGRMPRSSE
jgi:DNA-binding LacI/PurR family transcriptional regulator